MKALTGDDNLLTYIDTAPAILGSDGQPRKELFRDDGLHMNAHGYSHWNTRLRPVLANALKTP